MGIYMDREINQDGSIAEGEFVRGDLHGQGEEETLSDGRVEDGQFTLVIYKAKEKEQPLMEH